MVERFGNCVGATKDGIVVCVELLRTGVHYNMLRCGSNPYSWRTLPEVCYYWAPETQC